MPVSADAAIGDIFLDNLDRKLASRVLVLPAIRVCCSAHHMDFAGTLSVRHRTLSAYVMDILASVAAHGFYNLVMLNSHGGKPGDRAGDRGDVRCRASAVPHRPGDVVAHGGGQARGVARKSAFGGVGHACEFETSIMMHGAPDAVRADRIGPLNYVPSFPWSNSDLLIAGQASLYRSIKDMSGETGVLGDASLASAEKGKVITSLVVDHLAEILESMRTAPAHGA